MAQIDNDIQKITIGSFDGMHLAHQMLIKEADALVVIERQSGTLTPGYTRSRYTHKAMDFYLFDRICSLSPVEFIELLKKHYPNLSEIIVGYDFRFGAGRGGDAKDLKELFNGRVHIVPKITIDGIAVHARNIRRLLHEGDLRLANRLLGRRYRIEGEPIRGQGRGAKEFVPTINLDVKGYELPAEGVYAGYTYLGAERFASVIFIGYRDSTDGSFAVETHILDKLIAPIKQTRIAIEFEEFLRPNRRFENLAALKEQIFLDIQEAMGRLGLN